MQKKLNSTILYKGNIFTLSKDKVKIENQMIIERDVIHHNGGCAIIACKDDCLLMVRQYRYASTAGALRNTCRKNRSRGRSRTVCNTGIRRRDRLCMYQDAAVILILLYPRILY